MMKDEARILNIYQSLKEDTNPGDKNTVAQRLFVLDLEAAEEGRKFVSRQDGSYSLVDMNEEERQRYRATRPHSVEARIFDVVRRDGENTPTSYYLVIVDGAQSIRCIVKHWTEHNRFEIEHYLTTDWDYDTHLEDHEDGCDCSLCEDLIRDQSMSYTEQTLRAIQQHQVRVRLANYIPKIDSH